MEVISNHRELKEAVEAAVNRVLGPNSISLISDGYWALVKDDNGNLVINPSPIRITVRDNFKCTVSAKDNEIELSWQIPTTRANGDELRLEDIKEHEVHVTTPIGEFNTFLPPDITNYSFVHHGNGLYSIKMRTYDKDGLVSDWSNEVTKEVV